MTHQSIQELFGQTAERLGDRVAVERGDLALTYAELEGRANGLANFLLAGGAGKGTVVAVLTPDVLTIITALVGTLKAGCVFVPLDPDIPGQRLGAMAAEVSPSWFVTHPSLAPLAAGLAGGGADLLFMEGAEATAPPEGAGGRAAEEFAARFDPARPAVSYEPDDVAYVYFTSGSTGRPKGIAGRLKGIDHFINWEVKTFGLGEGTRVSQLTSPSFDAFLRDIFTPLRAGGTVCVPESRDMIPDAARLVAWLDGSRVNLVHCVPSLFRAVVNQPLRPEHFPALRYVLTSGEPLLPADVRRWYEVFGERVQLVNLYGPTETTMTKFFHLVTPSDAGRRSIPIGKPMEGARALVLDARGRACLPGAVGEIYIRTPYRTHGYYNQPELTREVFVPNPFSDNPADLIYKTGDLGRVDEDGNFEFIGRKDQQVKVRGVRIELKEVEDALRRHDSVADVAVIDRDDPDGTKYLCAYVVTGGAADGPELKEFLSHHLPSYMVPTTFVRMDELPRTISGKVDRKALPTPGEQRGAAHQYVAPRTPLEEVLAGIWSSVIGIETVGVNDNFFDLGGHSLLATQLLARVNRALGVELPLRSLFEAPTVAGQAAQAAAARGSVPSAPPPIKPAPREGRLPLSFAQQRLWFIDQLQPGGTSYNLHLAVRLRGRLDVGALERTLEEIVRRHEILRTTFETVDGVPAQVIAPAREVKLPVVDCRATPAEEQERELRRLIEEEARRPCDLSAGPLLRALLVRLGEEEHVVGVTIHHIISDGGSIGILFAEVATLYEAFSAGRPSPLPELQVQYADYAVWQREWLAGEVLEAQLAYWREKLAGASATQNFPADRPRPDAPANRGGTFGRRLPEGLAEGLKAIARREGATLYMTLLGAFKVLLLSHTGEEDVVLGTPISNRNRIELEPLIGFFANTLVLRTDLSGDPTFGEVLRRVRETVLGAFAHQDAPFEKLVDELRPERSLNRNPLFQVSFTVDSPAPLNKELPGITLNHLSTPNETTQFDFVMHMVDSDQGLFAYLQYSTDLFDEPTVVGVMNDFEALLGAVVERPEATVSELRDALAEARRREWTAKEREVEEAGLSKLKSVRRKALKRAGADHEHVEGGGIAHDKFGTQSA
ncbi:MAG TPA: amino acid adenylation domain-containing protein [Pyrinomonadaceae bacterium]|jgi:amino acid adenylation domain-containing protein